MALAVTEAVAVAAAAAAAVVVEVRGISADRPADSNLELRAKNTRETNYYSMCLFWLFQGLPDRRFAYVLRS